MKIDTGSNKSLFTMIAVVVFGIFLSLSYWLFQDQIHNVLASVTGGVKSGTVVTMGETLDGNYNLGANDVSAVVVPNAESDFYFTASTGTITGYKGTRKDVVIPSTINGISVKDIGSRAFMSKGLTSVVIPSSVIWIRYEAFYYNVLASVSLSEGLVSIAHHAFSENAITTLVIPNSVTSIGDAAFRHNKLTNLTLGTGVTIFESWTFEYNQLTSVTIPSNVTSLGFATFRYNPLTSAQVASGRSYSSSAFADGTVVTIY